ncbi:hypothetical protein [Roseovarius indicus]|uniref:hypothetical protein n=1 Tax=Roseovarius indicus TaxID=540747 RepID=UPI0010FD8A80|nr:hypothetical protein [Roseovarius indicus]
MAVAGGQDGVAGAVEHVPPGDLAADVGKAALDFGAGIRGEHAEGDGALVAPGGGDPVPAEAVGIVGAGHAGGEDGAGRGAGRIEGGQEDRLKPALSVVSVEAGGDVRHGVSAFGGAAAWHGARGLP